MSYQLIFADKALKQLAKLDRPVQERILAALERIRVRPERHVKKLVGDPGYRLRVGDNRVLMDLDRGRLVILVLKVGYQRGIYG